MMMSENTQLSARNGLTTRPVSSQLFSLDASIRTLPGYKFCRQQNNPEILIQDVVLLVFIITERANKELIG
jgi:hypothetical protein